MLLKMVKGLIKGLLHLFLKLTVHNIENFPKEGAVVIAINHKNLLDGPLCAALLPRKIYFMAKCELFKNKLLGSILSWAGAFPVNRGTADIAAIKKALTILKEEKCMAIFPEGTRVKEGQKHEVKSGVAMIASKAKAPVIPVAIKGTYGFFKPIDIFIGKPIYVENAQGTKLSHEEIEKYSKQIMYEVLKMAGEDVESLGC